MLDGRRAISQYEQLISNLYVSIKLIMYSHTSRTYLAVVPRSYLS